MTAAARRTLTKVVIIVAVLGAVGLGAAACTDAEDDQLTTAEFCTELEAVQPLIDSFGQLETTQIPDQRAALDAIADQAPAEISTPFAALVAYIDAAADALAPVKSGDVTAAREALRSLGDQTADAQAAGQAVEPWVAANCGFDLRSGDTVAPPPEAPPTTAPTDPAAATTAPPGD